MGALGKDNKCSDFELRGLQKAAAAYISMQQQQQNSAFPAKKAEEEGFTRSISLYWHWVRGQKAASKMGKVSRGLLAAPTHAPPTHAATRNTPFSPAGARTQGAIIV